MSEAVHGGGRRATVETSSAREAVIKWSRALQGGPWRTDAAAFASYAAAACQLADCFCAAAVHGSGPNALR